VTLTRELAQKSGRNYEMKNITKNVMILYRWALRTAIPLIIR